MCMYLYKSMATKVVGRHWFLVHIYIFSGSDDGNDDNDRMAIHKKNRWVLCGVEA